MYLFCGHAKAIELSKFKRYWLHLAKSFGSDGNSLTKLYHTGSAPTNQPEKVFVHGAFISTDFAVPTLAEDLSEPYARKDAPEIGAYCPISVLQFADPHFGRW